MSIKGFIYVAALLIVLIALVYDSAGKKGSIWKVLFRIFKLAESTSQYRRRQRTGA